MDLRANSLSSGQRLEMRAVWNGEIDGAVVAPGPATVIASFPYLGRGVGAPVARSGPTADRRFGRRRGGRRRRPPALAGAGDRRRARRRPLRRVPRRRRVSCGRGTGSISRRPATPSSWCSPPPRSRAAHRSTARRVRCRSSADRDRSRVGTSGRWTGRSIRRLSSRHLQSAYSLCIVRRSSPTRRPPELDAQEIKTAVAHQAAERAAAEAPFVNRARPGAGARPGRPAGRQPPRPDLGGRPRREVERLALAAQPPGQRPRGDRADPQPDRRGARGPLGHGQVPGRHHAVLHQPDRPGRSRTTRSAAR